jgi:hypothetical protein
VVRDGEGGTECIDAVFDDLETDECLDEEDLAECRDAAEASEGDLGLGWLDLGIAPVAVAPECAAEDESESEAEVALLTSGYPRT